MLARRSFLIGLGSAFAAPAIVRAASIMPVKVMPSARAIQLVFRTTLPPSTWRLAGYPLPLLGVVSFNPDLSDLGEPYLTEFNDALHL